MKVMLCAKCGDIRAFEADSWTSCKCGNMSAKWDDPQAGTVLVRAKLRDYARFIGLNNSMLLMAMRDAANGVFDVSHEAWRQRHETAIDAPDYIFDKSNRACWACIIPVGRTCDIKWDETAET